MSFTLDVDVTQDDWTALTGGGVDAAAQLKTDGPVLIVVATSKPDAASTAGQVLDRNGPEGIYYGVEGVEASDVFYGRSIQDETNTLAMTIAGAEPE